MQVSLEVRKQEIDRGNEAEAKIVFPCHSGSGLSFKENTKGPHLEMNFLHELSSHNTNITINDSIS